MLKRVKALFSGDKFDSVEEKIPLVIIKLEGTLNKLNKISTILINEDRELFEKCIDSRVRNDFVHAMMYANECAEIRKIAHMLVSSRYALEQMVLRLRTIIKLSDLLVTMSPVIDVIKETQHKLVGLVPSAANNLNEANQILNKCFENMGTNAIRAVNPMVYGEGAKKVLEEAEMVAEETIRERFPAIPETKPQRLSEAEMLA